MNIEYVNLCFKCIWNMATHVFKMNIWHIWQPIAGIARPGGLDAMISFTRDNGIPPL